jgi:hypothetical protein
MQSDIWYGLPNERSGRKQLGEDIYKNVGNSAEIRIVVVTGLRYSGRGRNMRTENVAMNVTVVP